MPRDREKYLEYQKQYHATYDRDYYQKNKEKIMARKRERRKEIREWLREYKSQLKCVRCGESEICCLDFHHVDPSTKESNIGIIGGYSSKKKIMEEIEKCEVLCANCHRKEHNGAWASG